MPGRVWSVKRGGTIKPLGGTLSLASDSQRHRARRGTRELLAAYGDSPWIRAIVGKISSSCASTEWQVMRPTRKASAGDRAAIRALRRAVVSSAQRQLRTKAMQEAGVLELVDDHPLCAFLERGNDYYPGQTMQRVLFAHYELVGDGFAMIERAGGGKGEPTSWSVISPEWVEKIPVPGGPAEFEVRPIGYGTAGSAVKIPASQMLWFLDMDPVYPYGRGVGTGRALADEIDGNEYASRHIVASLANGGLADMIVTLDGASPDELKRFQDSWFSKLKGLLRKVPVFLSHEVKVEKVSQSFEELQLAELRDSQRDVIMQTWGIPPEVMGLLENANRATITSAERIYASHVCVPRLDRHAATMQRQLLPMWPGSENDVVSYVSPVADDPDFKLAAMTAAHASSAHTVDEWRELTGHAELEGDKGKVYVYGLGLVSGEEPAGGPGAADDLLEDPDEDPEAEETPEEGPEDEDTDDDEKSSPRAVTRAKPKPKTPKVGMTKAEAELLAKQLGRKVKDAELANALGPALARTVATVGQDELNALGQGVKFDVYDPRVSQFLKTNAVDRAKTIGDKSRKKIRSILHAAVKDGDTLNDVTPRIMGIFRGSMGAKRALRIGVTESTRASNFGALEGMRQGGVSEKEWLSVRGDGKTRDTHVALDRQRVAIGSEFHSEGGAEAQHPGEFGVAEEDINCRCAILAVVEGSTGVGDEKSIRKLAWERKDNRRVRHQREIKNAAEHGLARQWGSVKAELDQAIANGN